MTKEDKHMWEVEHPEEGKCRVEGVDRYEAIVAAAKAWGVRWTVVAKDCAVRDLGCRANYPCRGGCGAMLRAPGYCSDCKRRRDAVRREGERIAARMRAKERRG